MATEWYYARHGVQFGPVSATELKRLAEDGQIHRTDLVWRAGMQEWKPARQVKGLFSSVEAKRATPPSLPPAPPPIAPPPPAPPSSGGFLQGLTRFFEGMSDAALVGRWLLEDDPATWFELRQGAGILPDYVATRSDGDFGTWSTAEKGKFIILTMRGKPQQRIQVLRIEPGVISTYLHLQDANGSVSRYLKARSEIGNSIAMLLDTDRTMLTTAKWWDADAPNVSWEFTKEGAFIGSDASAGQFILSRRETHKRLTIRLTNGTMSNWTLVSITNEQLVLSKEGGSIRVFRQHRSTAQPEKASDDAAKSEAGSTEEGATGLTYFDCPMCGTPFSTKRFDPALATTCGHCGSEFPNAKSLNIRTTSERIEQHSLLERLVKGSGIQASRKEYLEQREYKLQRNLNLAKLRQDWGAAQTFQMELSEVRRELREEFPR